MPYFNKRMHSCILVSPYVCQLVLSLTLPPWGFPGGSEGKASACNTGDPGSIPGSGRSPGEGNGNPLQYSCLGNPMDGGTWWATVHGVTESQMQLSDITFTLPAVCLLLSTFSSADPTPLVNVFHLDWPFPSPWSSLVLYSAARFILLKSKSDSANL